MVGREIENLFDSDSRVPGNVILEVKGLTKKGKFEHIKFQVHAREVLGIAGLMGAGRTEIVRAIFGLDKIDSGEILLKGHKIEIRSPKDAIEQGIVYVSEDRKALGFIPELSVIENITLSNLKNFSKEGSFKLKKRQKFLPKWLMI